MSLLLGAFTVDLWSCEHLIYVWLMYSWRPLRSVCMKAICTNGGVYQIAAEQILYLSLSEL